MKKIIFSLSLAISCLNINATDLFVYPGGTSPDFNSIAIAVDSASDGDRILVSNGSYFGDVTIDEKSISILPVVSSNSYTIQGNIILKRNTSGSTAKLVTISSAEIIGDFEYQGNVAFPYEINIINCNSFGTINLKADNIITNIYYSTFYNSIYLNASFEIVGNTFESSSSSIDTFFVEDANWNIGGSLASSTIKVFANHFKNYQLKCDLAANSMLSKIHIANNYMNFTVTTSISLLDLNGPSTNCLIENNTLSDVSQSTHSQYSGDILKSSNGMVLLEIRNNLILSGYWVNSSSNNYSYAAFNFFPSGRGTILKLENNFFNNNSITISGNVNASYSPYFYSTPYSTVLNDNVFSTAYSLNSTLILNDTSGIPSAGVLTLTEDVGKDIMECRDIDDTQNDIGPWGGPHSWENYHLNSLGSAKVIDIDINSSINSITNGSLNIKAKSVNTNQ
jgi:hypothetical protein